MSLAHGVGCGVQRTQKGMALIAVLWIVAALSILVAGMSQAVRVEARLVSSARQIVVASALGDAAIHLVLQAMVASAEPLTRLATVQTRYQGLEIAVQILPLNGLIDINSAPEPLLARLFVLAGGAAPADAAVLAHAAVELRAARGAQGRAQGFEAQEDLMRVPGLDYDLYANIAPLVTADQAGSGRVNPMAAPEGVLAVLADGNVALAASIAAERSAGGSAIDTTTLTGDYIDSAATRRFQLQARVPLPDGGWVLVSRSVDLRAAAQGGLPWRTFRAEQRLEPRPSTPSS